MNSLRWESAVGKEGKGQTGTAWPEILVLVVLRHMAIDIHTAQQRENQG